MQTIPNVHRDNKIIGKSIGNETSPRRSSATTISNRPPLPTGISNRSQSMDDHLDIDKNSLQNGTVQDTEGASDHNQSSLAHNNNNINTTENTEQRVSPTTKIIITDEQDHPKSKSMDDLLMEKVEEESTNYEDRSKSLDILSENSSVLDDDNNNNSENRINRSDANSIGSTSSLNQICTSPKPDQREISNEGNQDDTKSNSTFYSQTNSTGSQNSDKKRTFLNKYVKKMKSLIKK